MAKQDFDVRPDDRLDVGVANGFCLATVVLASALGEVSVTPVPPDSRPASSAAERQPTETAFDDAAEQVDAFRVLGIDAIGSERSLCGLPKFDADDRLNFSLDHFRALRLLTATAAVLQLAHINGVY